MGQKDIEPQRNSESIYKGRITISFPWDLPERLSGPSVMFDINSASYNIANLVSRAGKLFVVTKDNVHQALEQIPQAVLIGESSDPTLKEKFVSNNAASSVAQAPVEGKDIVLITNNGTHTLDDMWQKGASPVVVGHYANLRTVTNWLIGNYQDASQMTLVPSGGREEIYKADPNLLEDRLCAEAMESLLKGGSVNLERDYLQAKEAILQTNPPTSGPQEANFALLFPKEDTFPVVPICKLHENGLMQIVDALKVHESV